MKMTFTCSASEALSAQHEYVGESQNCQAVGGGRGPQSDFPVVAGGGSA